MCIRDRARLGLVHRSAAGAVHRGVAAGRGAERRQVDLHPAVGDRVQFAGGGVVRGGVLVGDQPGDGLGGDGREHAVRAELGVVGEDDDLGGRLHQCPVHARGQHVRGRQAAFGAQPAPGDEGLGDPQPLQRLLGAAAHQRVVGAAQGAAGHHHLDPVGVGQCLGDQQGVGDDGQAGHPGQPAGQLLGGGAGADHHRVALLHQAGGEVRDGALLRRGQVGLLRVTGFAAEAAGEHRAAVPAVEEPFCLQRPHVPAHGHFGGLDDAGQLPERDGSVGAHHFEDQLATFCCKHRTDGNLRDRLLSGVCS